MTASARPAEPFALVAPGVHGLLLSAVNREAQGEGLKAGMRLADARAAFPALAVREAEPEADRQGLLRLALWCGRFTPWSAPDGEDGLMLDITGCAHLFGGEEAMVAEVENRLGGLGFEARAGLADTPGAAWALARFAPAGGRIAGPGSTRAAIEDLPVEALRITAETALLLRRLGLATIGALADLPRVPLARRFPSKAQGEALLQRLDQALGRRDEPLSPLSPPPDYLRRLAFTEPLLLRESVEAALADLLAGLVPLLERDHRGVRRLVLWCFRVDGSHVRVAAATARASRDADHLARLFAEKLDGIDAGFGIDVMALHAARVEPLEDDQLTLAGRGRARDGVDRLVDRLLARLGNGAVARLEPAERHIPEAAERAVPPGRTVDPWPGRPEMPQRPFRLFGRPEPVEVMAEVPDGPPLIFTWRRVTRRVARAAGPERIAPEWWIGDDEDEPLRDYYRVEDTTGRRYWLYRAGLYQDSAAKGPPRWYVHGLYG